MAKTSTVVLRARPATGGAHGRTGTRREVGESQGGARSGLTRRRFGWQRFGAGGFSSLGVASWPALAR